MIPHLTTVDTAAAHPFVPLPGKLERVEEFKIHFSSYGLPFIGGYEP